MPPAAALGAPSAVSRSKHQKATCVRVFRRITILVGLLLSGCALQSETIRGNFVDYNDAIGETANKFVVTNILEARDNAPLHFMDIPKINGLLRTTASASASLPFLARTVGSATGLLTGTITPTLSVESDPGFEVDHSNLKEFVTGVSSPIDPKWVKYWIDRGLDNRIILLLFISSAQITYKKPGDKGPGETIVITNAPRIAADQLAVCAQQNKNRDTLGDERYDKCHARTEFELYLRLIDSMQQYLTASTFTQPTMVASGIGVPFKDVAAIDPAKYQVKYFKNENRYELYTISPEQIALCLTSQSDRCSKRISIKPPGENPDSGGLPPTVPFVERTVPFAGSQPREVESGPCTRAPGIAKLTPYCEIFLRYMEDDKRSETKDYSLHFSIRSVAEMIHFVGDVEYYQERMRAIYMKDGKPIVDYHHNNPLTLGWSEAIHPPASGLPARPGEPDAPGSDTCDYRDGGCLFRLNGKAGVPRFTVAYGGKSYTVNQSDPEAVDKPQPVDHSLEVIALLNQMVNLNKSASEIRTTPLIQVLQ